MRSLVSLLAAQGVILAATQRRSIERIDAENFDAVARKTFDDLIKQGEVPTLGYVERGIFALRKYHAIAVLDPYNGHAISEPLDPFWHSQILFTVQYFKFCNESLGHYMHHYPLDHNDGERVAGVRKLYDYTIKVHHVLFGADDHEFYPPIVTNEQLVCLHARDTKSPLTKETTFPLIPELVVPGL